MSAEKYPSIFSRQMETIFYVPIFNRLSVSNSFISFGSSVAYN